MQQQFEDIKSEFEKMSESRWKLAELFHEVIEKMLWKEDGYRSLEEWTEEHSPLKFSQCIFFVQVYEEYLKKSESERARLRKMNFTRVVNLVRGL